MAGTDFVVAVNRASKDQLSNQDLDEVLREIPGVELCGAVRRQRVRICVDEEALMRVRERLGSVCHIEPVIRHRPLGGSS